jgi:hypothetical protein
MEDIRFSRSINVLQKIVVAELNKLAMIHLYAKGFDGEDLINFELNLSNPSSVAIQQKLNLWSTKLDILAKAKDLPYIDDNYIQKKILELSDEEIDKIQLGRVEDKQRLVVLDAITAPPEETRNEVDAFDPTNYDYGVPSSPLAIGDKSKQPQQQAELVPADTLNWKLGKGEMPVRTNPYVTRMKANTNRRKAGTGSLGSGTPDFNRMLSPRNRTAKDVYDQEFLNNPVSLEEEIKEGLLNEKLDTPEKIKESKLLTYEMKSILSKYCRKHPRKDNEVVVSVILTEDNSNNIEVGEEEEVLFEDIKVEQQKE